MDLQWFAHNKRVASRQSVLTPDSVGEEQGVASGTLPPAHRQSDGVLNRIQIWREATTPLPLANRC